MARLRQVVIDNFHELSKCYEGDVPWMYLDCKGLVTTGVGNLIDTPAEACKLPWVHASDMTPASQAEIAAEWHTVKAHQELAHQGYQVAKAYCRLRLTDPAIDALVRAKLQANWDFMCAHYSSFANAESWPAPAQLAASLMAWAVGAGFPAIFKNWAAQAAQSNWGTYVLDANNTPTGAYTGCAGTCHISEVGNPGVIPRNKAILALYLLANVQPPDAWDRLDMGAT